MTSTEQVPLMTTPSKGVSSVGSFKKDFALLMWVYVCYDVLLVLY